ncbi:hypothetical protein [Megasphaera sp.]|uniref:hypothetical protein n=1 Tax=Megasphaera sp. TaxID=2023260 RepID=UPI00257F00F4|nr:hypothetical protein [Megasphaera sp.]
MGKFNQGILGGFTGKVGGVVGARSRGQWIYRAYQGVVKNPKTIAQTRQRDQFKIFSQEVTKVCKADMFMFNAAFPNAMTEHSFLVSICFNMLRAYQKYPKKPFETMKNVGLTKGIVNIGGLIDYAPKPSAQAHLTGPTFGSKADVSSPGEKFYGLNFGGDVNYYSEVIANQGTEGVQNRLLAMWLTKGNDGFYHVVIARQEDIQGISTADDATTTLSGVAKCNFTITAEETDGWAWVKGTIGTGDNWTILYTGGNGFGMAEEDDGGNPVTQVPVYYNWFTNSGKVPIGSMCKLIGAGVVTA